MPWPPIDLDAYGRLVHTIHTLEAAGAAAGTGWLFDHPDALAPWDTLPPAHRQIDRDVAQAIIDRYQADRAATTASTRRGLAYRLIAAAQDAPPARREALLGTPSIPDDLDALVARLARLGTVKLRVRLAQASQEQDTGEDTGTDTGEDPGDE